MRAPYRSAPLGAILAIVLIALVAPPAFAGPVLSRSPGIINFGNVQIATTTFEQTVSVVNTGDATLDIGTLSITGSGAAHFAIGSDFCSNVSLGPGSSCFVGVTFGPTSTGAKSATLQIPSNAPGSPATVALSGTGVNPSLGRTPSSLAYGNVQTGTTSFEQTVSITNNGTGNGPLNIGTLTITGTSASEFAIGSDSCSGVTLSQGQSCFVGVTFGPTSTGAKAATLQIPSNDPDGPDSASLSGTGVSPSLTRTPSSLTFGNVQTGTTTFEQTVSVTNSGTGNGPLNVGTLSITGPAASQFAIGSDSCSNATLLQGQSCFVGITFGPTSTGAKTATLQIPSNDPDTPETAALSGTGVAPSLTRTPASLDYGSVTIGSTTFEQTVSVTNSGTGNGPLEIGALSITGSGASQFTIGSNSCSNATISPGQNCFVGISFGPTAAGPIAAALQIPSNDPDSPETVTLSGTGVSPVTLSPTSATFGLQQVGTTGFSQGFTVTNNGTAGTAILSVATGGANAGDFTIQSDSCSGLTLLPSGTCTISVAFAPTAAGARAGTLVVSHDAPGSPLTSGLAGTGTAPAVSVAPGSLTFAAREIGTASLPQALTITNTGNAPLTVGTPTVGGAAPSDFTIGSSTCSGSIAPGGTCSIGMTFAPTATGSRDAQLSIPSNAPSSPTLVALHGTGVDTTGPSSTWTTANNSVRISLLQSVNGTSSDPSGIASVTVTFTDFLGSSMTVPATLDTCTAGNRSCSWSATVPLGLPGPTTARINAADALGNTSSGPTITVIVI